MVEKQYEKTGIKEYSNKRKKKREIEQQEQRRQKVKEALARRKYKESKKSCYDLSRMNFQKEYQKVKDLIENRREILSDENMKTLISGYQDYFDTYGKDMTALALRDFRRGILSTISISQNSVSRKNQVTNSFEKENSSREDVILDFCIHQDRNLEQRGLDMGMFFSLLDFLAQNGVPAKDGDDMEKIRAKVKSIHNELKNRK